MPLAFSARRGPESRFPLAAERHLDGFLLDRALAEADYQRLFAYFTEGFNAYRSPDGAHADYPGLPSFNGRRSDRLEGFSRFVPLAGAWVRSGRQSSMRLLDGTTLDLVDVFRRGLIAGTDPRSRAYWGRIKHYDQRIIEAGDLALSLWLFRDAVWKTLDATEKDNAVRWLSQVVSRRVYDNGWHLSIPFVGAVLQRLGYDVSSTVLRQHYERFKSFYRGDGWFSDGPGLVFDYYNAWYTHYLLFWLQEVAPDWDTDFICNARRQFLANYRYLLGPNGVPMFGRSMCYRLAVPTPLVLGHIAEPSQTAAGEARAALDGVWRYFVRRGGLAQGTVTQGYHGPDPRILENYSGPASSLWSLRSLVAAFCLPETSDFWLAGAGELPVEQGDYTVRVEATGWTIHGLRDGGVIELEMEDSPHRRQHELRNHGGWRQWVERLLGVPCRPGNWKAKYGRKIYRSNRPVAA